ncbi:MAG: hypothetical protein QOK37_1237 [Thermoanaerobaculia bacterium]|jgi:hypothetical protein|nr:hypothetical protein [Thermoanaerobaculia bacterium]
MPASDERRWLLLIHQLPPEPAYLRVRIARRMQRIGAIAIKNTVYVLPDKRSTREDFEWIVNEIREGGGEANLFEARVVAGLADAEIEQLFNAARNDDYDAVAASDDARELAGDVARLKKRLADIGVIDFFGASQGPAASARVEAMARRLAGEEYPMDAIDDVRSYANRIWVTRSGVHVDRMASAWLIRRFIDPNAEIRFVAARNYRPRAGEIRFDMIGGEFTHVGNRCTFEVMASRLVPRDRALRAIGEVVHDIDLKESAFDRPETAGIALLVAGIAMGHSDDQARIERSAAAFEDLYAYYQRKER